MELDSIGKKLAQHILKLEEGKSLAAFSPIGVGGVADYFTEANDLIELASALNGAIATKVPYMVLGSGGGLIFSDGGFPGLVIQNRTTSVARAADRSQAVVDSGISLNRLVTLLAGYELGGLTSFYGETGSVGAALYSGLVSEGKVFSHSVRSVTLFAPSRYENGEPKIVRHPVQWLASEKIGVTRLQKLRQDVALEVTQPVILTATFQLTSNRSDELAEQLSRRVKRKTVIPTRCLGPLFHTPLGENIDELLNLSSVKTLRVGKCSLHQRHLNFLEVRGGRTSAREVRELIDQVVERVATEHRVALLSRYEYVGVW